MNLLGHSNNSLWAGVKRTYNNSHLVLTAIDKRAKYTEPLWFREKDTLPPYRLETYTLRS